LRQERSRGHQMVPREPSDIARIGMLGAKRELLIMLYYPSASLFSDTYLLIHRDTEFSRLKLGYALKAGQLTYDCRYSTMHGMPVTGGRGFRGLKPLWYNGVPL